MYLLTQCLQHASPWAEVWREGPYPSELTYINDGQGPSVGCDRQAKDIFEHRDEDLEPCCSHEAPDEGFREVDGNEAKLHESQTDLRMDGHTHHSVNVLETAQTPSAGAITEIINGELLHVPGWPLQCRAATWHRALGRSGHRASLTSPGRVMPGWEHSLVAKSQHRGWGSVAGMPFCSLASASVTWRVL